VEEGRVVEPDEFVRARVSRYGGAHRARAQAAPFLPLEFDAVTAAVLLDDRALCGLEDRAPVEPEAVAEVAHVHPAFLGEPLSDASGDAGEDAAAVGNRGLAPGG
jgi:hypothetical protein